MSATSEEVYDVAPEGEEPALKRVLGLKLLLLFIVGDILGAGVPAVTGTMAGTVYGMARRHVLPRPLGKVLPVRRTSWAGIAFSTVLALGLILYVTSDPGSNIVANLSGTTAFLLLCVFTVVNVACVVLRRKRDPNRKVFFTSPGPCPSWRPSYALSSPAPGWAAT